MFLVWGKYYIIPKTSGDWVSLSFHECCRPLAPLKPCLRLSTQLTKLFDLWFSTNSSQGHAIEICWTLPKLLLTCFSLSIYVNRIAASGVSSRARPFLSISCPRSHIRPGFSFNLSITQQPRLWMADLQRKHTG